MGMCAPLLCARRCNEVCVCLSKAQDQRDFPNFREHVLVPPERGTLLSRGRLSTRLLPARREEVVWAHSRPRPFSATQTHNNNTRDNTNGVPVTCGSAWALFSSEEALSRNRAFLFHSRVCASYPAENTTLGRVSLASFFQWNPASNKVQGPVNGPLLVRASFSEVTTTCTPIACFHPLLPGNEDAFLPWVMTRARRDHHYPT